MAPGLATPLLGICSKCEFSSPVPSLFLQELCKQSPAGTYFAILTLDPQNIVSYSRCRNTDMGLLSVTQGHWLQTHSSWINIHADPSGPNTQCKQADILDPRSGPPPCVPGQQTARLSLIIRVHLAGTRHRSLPIHQGAWTPAQSTWGWQHGFSGHQKAVDFPV